MHTWRDPQLIDLTGEPAEVFLRVLSEVPHGTVFSVNDVRDRLDAAGVPERLRGGLFSAACSLGVIRALDITVYGRRFERRVPSTGRTAKRATVREYRRTDVPP